MKRLSTNLWIFVLHLVLTLPALTYGKIGNDRLPLFGFDPHALAMGRAYTANTNGVVGIFANPAGLGYVQGREFVSLHSFHPVIKGLSYDLLCAGSDLGTLGIHGVRIAVGALRLSSTGYKGRDENGTFKGEFGYGDDICTIGGGGEYSKYVRIGLAGYIERRWFDNVTWVRGLDGGERSKSRWGLKTGVEYGPFPARTHFPSYFGLVLGYRKRFDTDENQLWGRTGGKICVTHGTTADSTGFSVCLAYDVQLLKGERPAYFGGMELKLGRQIVMWTLGFGLSLIQEPPGSRELTAGCGLRLRINERVEVEPDLLFRTSSLYKVTLRLWSSWWFAVDIRWLNCEPDCKRQ